MSISTYFRPNIHQNGPKILGLIEEVFAYIRIIQKLAQRRKFQQNWGQTNIFIAGKAKSRFCTSLQDNLKQALHNKPMAIAIFTKSQFVPPKFPYVTNCSSKPLACFPIYLLWDTKHCSLVVMLGGGVSYLIATAKLMQNKGYVHHRHIVALEEVVLQCVYSRKQDWCTSV